jgi:LacI family transcriptional regulator
MKRRKKDAQADAGRTMEEVCDALGVSTATVSRVLNNKPGVGAELRKKVLAAVKELNYVPRAAARQLSSAKSDTLGIAFQDLTAGWLLTIFRGIISRAAGRYHVITSISVREGDEYEVPSRLLAERRVDGLIWLDPRATPQLIKRMKSQPVPFVVLQRQVADPEINSIAIDSAQGAREAVTHLLNCGYRKLLLLTGPRDDADSQQKLDGARQALREFSVNLPAENILEGHHVGTHAVRAISDHLAAGRPLPEAIFAFNDAMAIAILHWLRGRGIRVPQDVALIGFDGIDEAKQVGLTTFETPMYEMGVLATQVLMDLIVLPPSERRAKQLILKGTLAIRDTCGRATSGKPS